MPDPSLLTAFDEIRGKTLRLVDVPQEQALSLGGIVTYFRESETNDSDSASV